MAWLATFCCMLLLAACGGGSGRQGTDIVVTGSGPTAQVAGGEAVLITMLVSNAGSGDAGSMRINSLVGNQLALTAITCTAAGGAVCPQAPGPSMTVDGLPSGGSLSFAVALVASANASGTLSYTMTVQVEQDTNSVNNQATVTASAFSARSNLVVSGSGPGGTVTGGATAQFLMTVTNTGPDASTNVRIDSDVGSGLTLNALACTAAGGAVCPPTSPSMFVASLPSGGSLSFEVSTTVGAAVNGFVSNKLSAVADNDAVRSDNSFSASATVVTPRSGVFVTGTGPSAAVTGDSAAVFTMQVGNAGPDAATSLNLVNQVGSNLTLTGISCLAAGGAVCPTSTGPVMTVASLPAGATLTFSVNTLVAAGINGAVVNTLSITAANDSDRSDNSATAVATVSTPRARLTVTGSGPTGQVAGGASAAFVMTVGNTGPDAATSLRVVNTVGGNLTFVGATCAASGGATCPATVGVVTEVPTLPVGGQLSFSVNALVDAGANGAITNSLQASAANASGSNAVAVGEAFTARSGITVSGVGPDNVPAGTSANFQMTVTNTGPDPAASLHLVNTVGGNLTQTGISCSASGAAVCPAVGSVMDVSNLPVGGALVFNVAATVANGTQGVITNGLSATVTSGTRSSVSAVAVGSAYANSVSVSGTAPAGPLAGGASASFVMTVANAGPGAAENLLLSNMLSSGLSLSSTAIGCTATGAAVCPATPSANMTVPSLPAEGALTFSFPVVVDAGTNGAVSSSFTATAAGDSRATDNSSTVSSTASSVDVGVSQTGAAQVAAGSNAVFTAIVGNPGPSAVTDLTITHTLGGAGSAGATASIVCTASGGATCPTTGPSMSVPSLAAGRSLTFTITVPVAAGARGAVTSTVAVTAPGDPTVGNNEQTTATQAVDGRNGSYRAFGADGSAADLVLDFDAATYVMGSGGTQSFTAGAGNEFVLSTAVRFRVATDLVIGSHDFGNGLVPYVAGRSFGTTVAEAQGGYNLATREVPTGGGAAATRAGSAAVAADGTLFICQLPGGLPRPPSDCNTGLTIYALTVDGSGLYTATPLSGVSTSSYSFYLLRSDSFKLIVSTGSAVDASGTAIERFRIGLQDPPAVVGGQLAGGSTAGEWVDVELSSSNYSVTGTTNTAVVTASLATVSGSGASALLQGTRSDLASIYVIQAGPVAVAYGTFNGTANGLLQILAP
jgi:hypothetical protein